MRHRRYYIESLWTSGLAVPSTGGDLVVAAKEQTTDLDWELSDLTPGTTPFEVVSGGQAGGAGADDRHLFSDGLEQGLTVQARISPVIRSRPFDMADIDRFAQFGFTMPTTVFAGPRTDPT